MSLNNVRPAIRVTGIVATAGLGLALLAVAYVNYLTTYQPLVDAVGPQEWVRVLALAVVTTDFFSLVRFVLPKDEDVVNGKTVMRESSLSRILLFVWFLVSTLDTALTFYFTQQQIAAKHSPEEIAADAFLRTLPYVIAGIVWGVQFGLLYLFGKTIEAGMNSKIFSVGSTKSNADGGSLLGKFGGAKKKAQPKEPQPVAASAADVKPEIKKPAKPGSYRPKFPNTVGPGTNGSKSPVSTVPAQPFQGLTVSDIPEFLRGRSPLDD